MTDLISNCVWKWPTHFVPVFLFLFFHPFSMQWPLSLPHSIAATWWRIARGDRGCYTRFHAILYWLWTFKYEAHFHSCHRSPSWLWGPEDRVTQRRWGSVPEQCFCVLWRKKRHWKSFLSQCFKYAPPINIPRSIQFHFFLIRRRCNMTFATAASLSKTVRLR
jgi:hypothetical protein